MLTKSETAKLQSLAIKASREAENQDVRTAVAHARSALPKVVVAMDEMSRLNPNPEMRHKAAIFIRDMVTNAAVSEVYEGEPDALVALAGVPVGQQWAEAMKMFALGQINRRDLDTIKDLIKANAEAHIEALKVHNGNLVKRVEQLNGEVERMRSLPTSGADGPIVDGLGQSERLYQ